MFKILLYAITLFIIPANQIFGDQIILTNGQNIQGQLLRITDKNLIIEILSDEIELETITIDLSSVKSVIDESKTVLFEDGKLLVVNLDDYYRRLPFWHNLLDTLVFKTGDTVLCYISFSNDTTVFYVERDKKSKSSKKSKINEIAVLKENRNKDKKPYTSAPLEKIFYYPHFSIEFGFSTFLQNLNEYQNLFRNLEISYNNQNYNTNNLTLRNIPKSIYAINVGVGLHITKNFIFSALGHFTLGFGDNQAQGEVKEAYRIFLGDLKYLIPFKHVSPWVAVGLSFQSVTIINNFNEFNLKFQSSASTISLSSGFQINFSSKVGCSLAFRYLPFGNKNVTLESLGNIENIQETDLNKKIDLTNLILSASLFVNL